MCACRRLPWRNSDDPWRQGRAATPGGGELVRHPRPPEIGRLWASDWSLTALLGLLIGLVFFVQPLIGLGYDVAPVASLTFTLVLLSGVMAVAHTRTARIVLGAGALLAVAVHWGRYTDLGGEWPGAEALATLAACGMLAAIVFVQVYRPGPITHHRIQGAIAGYLLIAMVFASIYSWIDLHSPGAFSGGVTLSTVGDQRASRLAYFSLTTLTTLGYGDIVPVHPLARSLAMLEAVVGQVFPAILLARLVSLQMMSEREKRRADDEHH